MEKKQELEELEEDLRRARSLSLCGIHERLRGIEASLLKGASTKKDATPAS